MMTRPMQRNGSDFFGMEKLRFDARNTSMSDFDLATGKSHLEHQEVLKKRFALFVHHETVSCP